MHARKCVQILYLLIILTYIDFSKKGKCVQDLLHIHGMEILPKKQLVLKSGSPSSNDLALSNVPNRLQRVSCIDTELSDFHKMIVFATKITIPLKTKSMVFYRTFKGFRQADYLNDLLCTPFQVNL